MNAALITLAVTLLTASSPQVHVDRSDVRACAPLDSSTTLVGTGGGLLLLRGDRVVSHWTSLDGLPGTRVEALLRGPSGDEVLVGTDKGLALLVREGRSWTLGDVAATTAPLVALAHHGDDIVGALWGQGLHRLDRRRLAWVDMGVPDSTHIHALVEHRGRLLAGTPGSGILALDAGRLIPSDTPELAEHTMALASTDQGLWVGAVDGLLLMPEGPDSATFAGPDDTGPLVQAVGFGPRGGACLADNAGLWRRDAGTWDRFALPGLPGNDVTSLVVRGDRVIVGTFDHGLAELIDGHWEAIAPTAVDTRVNALALALAPSSDDTARPPLWVGTDRGLALIDGDKVSRWRASDGLGSDTVHAVTVLRDGRALVGTSGGAAIVSPQGRLERLGPKGRDRLRGVWAVAEAADGALWLGTSTGLYIKSPDGAWQRLSMASGHLRDDWVTALALAPDGETAWVGTYAKGVTRLDIESSETPKATHLGGGRINPSGLHLGESGTLYAATMAGLLAASGDTWRRLDQATTGEDVTAVVTRGRNLWVASRRGVVTSR